MCYTARVSLQGHTCSTGQAVELTSLVGREPGQPPRTEQWKDPEYTHKHNPVTTTHSPLGLPFPLLSPETHSHTVTVAVHSWLRGTSSPSSPPNSTTLFLHTSAVWLWEGPGAAHCRDRGGGGEGEGGEGRGGGGQGRGRRRGGEGRWREDGSEKRERQKEWFEGREERGMAQGLE